MAKNLKKLLSLVLAMIMVLSLIPAVSAAETDEEVTTEPETEETVTYTPSKTYEADEWIEVETAEEFLALTASGTTVDALSINAEANKGKVIGLKLMDDISIETTTKLYPGRYAAMYIGYYNADATKAFPVDVVLDLNGHTLTDTSTNSRMFGVYSGSKLVVTNGTILGNGNYTSTGGVFFSSGANDITLDGVTIIANGYKKTSHGAMMNAGTNGAIQIINSYLEIRDDGKALCRGGMFYIAYAIPVTLTNSTFVGGYAGNPVLNTDGSVKTASYGGQFAIVAGATMNITDCTFEGGKTDTLGGQFYIGSSSAQIAFDGCTFKNGTAASQGGMFYIASAIKDLTFTDCDFIGGSATAASKKGDGGQFYVKEAAQVTFEKCDFSGGDATGNGAKFYNYANVVIDMNECNFTGGNAGKMGGSIFHRQGTLNITDCTFDGGNAGSVGGNICNYGRGQMNISGGTIKNGTAATNGGNLANYNADGSKSSSVIGTLTMENVIVSGGVADSHGGNFYHHNSKKYTPVKTVMNNCQLLDGKAVSETASEVMGGNMYAAGYTLVGDDGTTPILDAEGNTIENEVFLNGCTVSGGQSARNGGNINLAGSSRVYIQNGTVVKDGVTLLNQGTQGGGGNIYMGNANSRIWISDSTVENGTSGTIGGNIRIGGGRIYADNATITGGTAKNGQLIYINDIAGAQFFLRSGTISCTGEEAALVDAGAGILALAAGTVNGFDPSAFLEDCGYIASENEGVYTIIHKNIDGMTRTGTCDEAGTVTIECAICEGTYTYEVEAGHSIVVDKAVAPTCTETGLTEGQHCAVCAAVLVAQEEIAATGHSPAEAVKENEVAHTCTTDGSYDSVIYCEVCKIELSREVGVVDPAAHTEQIVEGKAPTCTETGLTEGKVCSVCGETLVAQEEIPAAHTEKIVEGKAPTCTETGLTEGKVCEICGEVLVAQEELPVAEHAWDAGVYTEPTYEADGYTTYTCTACGETKVETDEGSMMTKAEITKQPEAVNAETGAEVQFHVEAEGNIVSYKWEYRKVWKWFNTSMTGYNTDTLTVTATGARNGYDYRCVITFADGTVLTTEPAELTVNTYITDVVGPNDQTVVNGYKGQFTASAQGEAIKYKWQYQRPGDTGWYYTTMEGNNLPTVLIETNTARDGYRYRCEITDVTGNITVYTEPATMRVLSFKSHPEETFAATGSTVTFTVTTSVDSGFTYQWQYSKDGEKWTNTSLTGYNTATLSVGATLARNGYQYRCVLTGSKNSKIESKAATLHVGDPVVITAQPQAVTVAAGEVATFTVEATNAYAYQWQYQRPTGTVWGNTSADGNQTATLNVTTKASNNGYKYRCVVYGLDGVEYITEIATLTIG